VRNLPLHILVNNAGISLVPFAETTDKIESNWAVNYANTMRLTLLLLDLVRQSRGRIVNVSSNTIRTGMNVSAVFVCLSFVFFSVVQLA